MTSNCLIVLLEVYRGTEFYKSVGTWEDDLKNLVARNLIVPACVTRSGQVVPCHRDIMTRYLTTAIGDLKINAILSLI